MGYDTRHAAGQIGGGRASSHGGEANCRGGRIDIEDRLGRSKIEEALEESFPASDAPCYTPYGYIDAPPIFRR